MTAPRDLRLPSHEKITEALHHCLEATIGSSRPLWTFHVSESLGKLCPRQWKVYGRHRRKSGYGEYLCDQVWAIEGDDWDNYHGLGLAMECEWSGSWDDNLHDYCKVLDVFAYRKVFIGSIPRPEWSQRKKRIKQMADMAALHGGVSDDSTVIVVLCEKGGEEDYGIWWVDGMGSHDKKI